MINFIFFFANYTLLLSLLSLLEMALSARSFDFTFISDILTHDYIYIFYILTTDNYLLYMLMHVRQDRSLFILDYVNKKGDDTSRARVRGAKRSNPERVTFSLKCKARRAGPGKEDFVIILGD